MKMISGIARILILGFILTGTGFISEMSSQTPTNSKAPALVDGTPESVGMSSARIARIEKMCAEAVQNNEVPGIVALVARKGKIVFHQAYGQANAAGKPLEEDHIFRIASQTKAITSTAVMMLWEEGLFQLDDPISKYIPEFANPQVLKSFRYEDTSYTAVPAASEITIRHLLTHTSGLGYGVIDGDERFKMIYHKAGITDLFTTEPVTIRESVLRLAKLPLHHNPGRNSPTAKVWMFWAILSKSSRACLLMNFCEAGFLIRSEWMTPTSTFQPPKQTGSWPYKKGKMKSGCNTR